MGRGNEPQALPTSHTEGGERGAKAKCLRTETVKVPTGNVCPYLPMWMIESAFAESQVRDHHTDKTKSKGKTSISS